ncbi:Uncharacterised protein [Grimontia hollisae]|uniref:Uncharacterized protein n=1 Tax=Grimontia hollisae TaxID=673 RepID=A0A377HP99_GRIHO|nr:Uncharacterised protein [Grimontia hollisae]STQ76374.1 Uncharacterised protein [Grimontia hollisae]
MKGIMSNCQSANFYNDRKKGNQIKMVQILKLKNTSYGLEW